MRCAYCGRRIESAAAEADPMPPLLPFGGPVGPVCAQRLGLRYEKKPRPARPFNLAQAMARLPRARAIPPDMNQLDLLEAIG